MAAKDREKNKDTFRIAGIAFGGDAAALGFDGISGETEPVDAVVVGETARCAALTDEAEVALAEAAVIVVAAAGAGAAAALLDTPHSTASSSGSLPRLGTVE